MTPLEANVKLQGASPWPLAGVIRPLLPAVRRRGMLMEMVTHIAKIVRMLKPRRRWFQFSVRSLFVLVALTAVSCAWLAWKLEQKRRERAAVATIEQFSAQVAYDRGGPGWVRRILGDDFLATPTSVSICVSSARGSKMRILDERVLLAVAGLTGVRRLSFGGLMIGDNELRVVTTLKYLEVLDINDTEVTDAGLVHLNHFAKLTALWLGHTNVTDAGLVHLAEVRNLKLLGLDGTKITDAGLSYVARLACLDDLSLSQNKEITDTGLAHLKRLSKLESLDLRGCPRVTNVGIAELQKALPNCVVHR